MQQTFADDTMTKYAAITTDGTAGQVQFDITPLTEVMTVSATVERACFSSLLLQVLHFGPRLRHRF
eukprot:SAG31_NODE_4276_length_3386_cov_1.703681_6_plen_66_part_00